MPRRHFMRDAIQRRPRQVTRGFCRIRDSSEIERYGLGAFEEQEVFNRAFLDLSTILLSQSNHCDLHDFIFGKNVNGAVRLTNCANEGEMENVRGSGGGVDKHSPAKCSFFK